MHFILYPLSVLKHWIILRDVYFRVNIPSVPTPEGITQNEIHFARSFFLISRSFLLRNSSTNSDTSMSLDVNHSTTFLSFFEFLYFLAIVSRLVKMFKRIISFLCVCRWISVCVCTCVYRCACLYCYAFRIFASAVCECVSVRMFLWVIINVSCCVLFCNQLKAPFSKTAEQKERIFTFILFLCSVSLSLLACIFLTEKSWPITFGCRLLAP